jgi:hypothetical protein
MKKFLIKISFFITFFIFASERFEIRDSEIELFFKNEPKFICKTQIQYLLKENPLNKKFCQEIPQSFEEIFQNLNWKDGVNEIQIAFADKDKNKIPIQWKSNQKTYQVISMIWKNGEEKGYLELLDERGIYSIRYLNWSSLRLGRGGFEPPKP